MDEPRESPCICGSCTAERLRSPDGRVTQAERWLQENRGPEKENWRNNTMLRHRDIKQRDQHIQTFGFAIINRSAVEFLKEYNPILEVGAGLGYWAKEMQESGVDTVATDPSPETRWPGQNTWTTMERLDAEEAVRKYPDRTLLMCWPDRTGDWPERAITAFTGKNIITIGEGLNGCTGTYEMHRILERDFDVTDRLQIPTFSEVSDRIEVWTTRKEGKV